MDVGEHAPLLARVEWESWFCSSLALALRRAGPAPCLGNLVELILVAWVQESWPQWYWRAGISPCQLPQVGELAPCLGKVGDLALVACGQESGGLTNSATPEAEI